MDKDWRLYAAAVLVVFGANTGSMLNAYSPSVQHQIPVEDIKDLDKRIDQINVLQQLVLHRLAILEAQVKEHKRHPKP